MHSSRLTRLRRRIIAPIAIGAAVAATLTLPATSTQAAGTVTITGTIRDGSDHAWPLWAKVSVDGLPEATTYSRPATGHFAVTVPADATYTLNVAARYPGYEATTQPVEVGTADESVDLEIPVDAGTCIAPGYHHTSDGLVEAFDSGATPDGWTVVEHIGNDQKWTFDDPGERGNNTGGTNGFAILDSDLYGYDYEYEGRQDTELISPVVDLTDVAEPAIGFNSDFTMWDYEEPSGIGEVDLSTDGGDTWQNIWHVDMSTPGPQQVKVPVPDAAGESDVRVRFHYFETDVTMGRWWEVDNVFIGNRRCDPIAGGLVHGRVRDANTGRPVVGATVEAAGASTASIATRGDAALPDGFFAMFVPSTGSEPFTVTKRQYHELTRNVAVTDHQATDVTFDLPTGRLAVSQSRLETSPRLGSAATVPLTLTNTGSAPLTIRLAERPGDFVLRPANGEPWSDVGEPAVQGWKALADYPLSIRDNMVSAYDGKIYSVGGVPSNSFGAPTAAGYVYDPKADAWSRIADMPRARQEGIGGFIDAKLYVVAGTTGDFGDDLTPTLDIYDPATDSWSTGASLPVSTADLGSAVLGGKLYAVGGCDTRFRCGSTDVYRYDPATDRWTQLADYPETLSWQSCGAIEERIYCAGGTNSYDGGSTSTYAYDPAADTWTRRADLPIDLFQAASTVAGGQLLMSGGIYKTLSTSRGFAYDPVADAWSPLPRSINEVARGGAACGFVKVGGAQSWSNSSPFVEMLPGHTDCGSDRDSRWLSTGRARVTLDPGERLRVSVRTDSGGLGQPGAYDATLLLRTDTPYGVGSVPVAMRPTPPKRWGKLMGRVSGIRCDGTTSPLPGADVWLRTGDDERHLTTTQRGRFARWADAGPWRIVVGKDGWSNASTKAQVRPGRATAERLRIRQLGCG